MLEMPHKPVTKCFSDMRMAVTKFIEENKDLQMDKFLEGDAYFFQELSEQWFILGMVDYVNQKPLEEIAEYIRTGLEKVQIMHELDGRFDAWKMWDYFLFSLSVSADGYADFFSALPDDHWMVPEPGKGLWLFTQVKSAFALYAGEDEKAEKLLEQLRVLVFEKPLAKELETQVPVIQNTYRLLKDLQDKDGDSFTGHLTDQMDLRAKFWIREGAISPMALIDLHGLGLSRIARDRGMNVTVKHVYLPLNLLDVK